MTAEPGIYIKASIRLQHKYNPLLNFYPLLNTFEKWRGSIAKQTATIINIIE
jgi:hypothetical protein